MAGWKKLLTGSDDLSAINNVASDSPSDGQFLKWTNGTSTWGPATVTTSAAADDITTGDAAVTISTSTGDINITPASGSAIVLDSTISVDAGAVTGATSITSTDFAGALTGNADTSTKIDSITNSNIVQLAATQTLSNKTIAASQVTEISGLTDAEGTQLENIGTTTISATQWGYLGAATGAITNTDNQLSQAEVEDFAGGLFSGNTETGITATYQAADNTIDLAVASDLDTTGNAGTVTTITGLAPDTAPTGAFLLPGTAATQGNITTVGVLNGGSITSGFGNINIGSSTFTTSGSMIAGSFSNAASGATVTISATTLGAIADLSKLYISNVTSTSAIQTSKLYNNLYVSGNAANDAKFQVKSQNETTARFEVDGSDGNTFTLGEMKAATYALGAGAAFSVDAAGDLVCNDIAIGGTFTIGGSVTVVNGEDVSTTNSNFLLSSGAANAAAATGSFFGVETGTAFDAKVKWTNSHTMGCGWTVSNHGADADENEDRHILTASTHGGIPSGTTAGTDGVPYNLSDGMVVIDTQNDDMYVYFA